MTELEVVEFERIANPDFPVLEKDVLRNLSKDQAYLYNICQAIMEGHLPPDLANQEPGRLNHSRWNTLGNRFLRKYGSTRRPSKQLKQIVHAIIHFYAPSWFQIKSHPRCTDGLLNFLKMIEYSRKLENDMQKVVHKTLQRNAFFAHPEAILLAMLADNDAQVRAQAVNQILTIRMKAQGGSQESSGEPEFDEEQKDDEADDDSEEDDDDVAQMDLTKKNAIGKIN